jgi:hypothetical protein
MAYGAVLDAEGGVHVRGVRCTEGVQPNERWPTMGNPVARERPRRTPLARVNKARVWQRK